LASPLVSAPSWPLPVSIAIALATLHCGGAPFVEEAADGSVGADDSVVPEAAGDESPVDAAGENDASAPRDARADAMRMADAPSDRNVPDGAHDAAKDVGAGACPAICAGCCDSAGQCQAGTAVGVCGLKGAACADCSTHMCPIVTDFGCCTTTGVCGCAIGAVVSCS
jgi:hypothetical protein